MKSVVDFIQSLKMDIAQQLLLRSLQPIQPLKLFILFLFFFLDYRLFVFLENLCNWSKFTDFLLFALAFIAASWPLRIFDFETFGLQFIVFHQFICSAIISILLIEDVLTNIIEVFVVFYVHSWKLENFLDYLRVYSCIFGIHLLFGDEMQVIWEILLVPSVILDFL